MTAREWKAGEVALIRVGFNEHVAIRDSSNGWVLGDSNAWRFIEDAHTVGGPNATVLRPLVVIDPEDREQVRRLVHAVYGVAFPFEARIPSMQAALREYADPKPPKPDEPTGRYAVVVDANDEEWVRTEWDAYLDKPWQNGPIHAHWQAVDAVKVLSEGVQS